MDRLYAVCSDVFGLPAYRSTSCCSFCELFKSDVTFHWIHLLFKSPFIFVKVGDSNRDFTASSIGCHVAVICT